MPLKQDIEKIFKNAVNEDNPDSSLTESDIAKEIVKVYKKAVNKGIDQYGNKWKVSSYTALENAIVAQFKLAFTSQSPLQFSLIETALIATWVPALLKLPATPAPGMSIVNSGLVLISTPVGTPPLGKAKEKSAATYDPIVNAFTNMFKNHAKTISFQYIGLAVAGTPPPPIVVPGAGITLT